MRQLLILMLVLVTVEGCSSPDIIINSEPDIIMTKDGHIKKINNNKIKCEEERLLGLVSTGKINCYIRRD